MEQQIIFTNKDISRMEISCPHCNEITSVPIPSPLRDDTMNSNPWQTIVYNKECPWCGGAINDTIANALRKLQDSFSFLSKEGVIIGFVAKK
jgi:ribosomal protein S27AE